MIIATIISSAALVVVRDKHTNVPIWAPVTTLVTPTQIVSSPLVAVRVTAHSKVCARVGRKCLVTIAMKMVNAHRHSRVRRGDVSGLL